MLNIDGGHYFLTVLTPVRVEPDRADDGTITSPTSALREVLATLPTAAQSVTDLAGGRQSPFARVPGTHLARWVVIDQPAYNGRVPVNSLYDAVAKTDLLRPQPVDRLNTAWLLLAIDFDADDSDDGGLDRYLQAAWQHMEAELRAVYRHCYRFAEDVRDGPSFAAYIRRCQVATTMPFNDYWITPPPLPSISIPLIGVSVVAFVLAAALGVAALGGSVLVAVPVALVLAVWLAYRYILAKGGKRFGTAPNSDLASVLKSLFIQQRFAELAIDLQGADAATIHAEFGRFLARTQPAVVSGPTQAPGVIRS